MKKYFLTSVFFTFFLFSCSNNDAVSSDTSLLGKWRLMSLTVENPVQVNGILTTNFTEVASDSQIEFKNNSVGTIIYTNGLSYYSQTIDENLEFCSTSSIESSSFEFVKNNNTITIIKDNNETLSLTLNGNTLIMEVENGIQIGNLDNNTNEHFTTKYVFSKE